MKRIAIYLGMTFGLTWGVQIPAGIATGAFTHGINAAPVMTVVVALSMFFPLVGALVTNALAGNARMDLKLKPRFRGNVAYYLLAWLVPALLTFVGAVLFFLVNPGFFDPAGGGLSAVVAQADASAEIPALTPEIMAITVVFAVLLAPLINAIPAFGEEAGWRGMLFPALCERMSPRAAVLVSGIIWGVWHAPVIAMGHNFGMAYTGFPVLGMLVMIVSTTTLGCLLSWLRMKTGSVWPCALAHGAVNASANVGVVFCAVGPTLAGPSPLGLIAGIPCAILAIIVWLKLK